MKWTNKGHQYDELAEIICKDEEYEYYIWGAGITGGVFYQKFKERLDIKGFIDSAKEKQQAGHENMPVYSIDQIIKKKNTRIVVSPAYFDEIGRILDGKGWKRNEEYFESHIFGCVYLMYKYDELYIHRTDVSLTERCTLKCKKCNMYMPFYKAPKDRSLKAVMEDFDCYFCLVTYVDYINLLGGEPFLYKQLPDVIEYLCDKYGDRIGRIEIFTNGTIVPDRELLYLIKKNSIHLGISDYTRIVPYNNKLNEFIKEIESIGITYRRERYEEWLDFGFPDNSFVLSEGDSLEKHFDECWEEFRGLYDRKYYYCHLNTSAIRAGLFREDSNDYFELLSDASKRELLEYDLGYCEKGYNTFCSVCKGCQSKDVIKAAEQITEQDVLRITRHLGLEERL